MIERLRIGALWIRVVHMEELKGAFAQWSSDRNRIEMGPLVGKEPTTLYTTTLLHEAIHVLSDLYEADFTEHQVRILEQGITSMFIDNSEFTKLYFGSIISFQNELPKEDWRAPITTG